MGYDIRFYIVNKSSFSIRKEKRFGEIIAEYEYYKDYDLLDFCNKFNDTDCYIFVDNDDMTLKDCYGDYLKEIPIKDMIDYLEKNPSFDYRRYRPFLHLLKGFMEEIKSYEDLVILKYGH